MREDGDGRRDWDELLFDLEDFAGGSDPKAAFERVWKRTEPTLRGHIATHVSNPSPREDVLQETAKNIWAAREGYQPRGVPQWFGYARTVAERCALEMATRRRIQEAPEEEDPPDPSTDHAVEVEHRDEVRRLYELADDLWLWRYDIEQAEKDRRMLAAQLLIWKKLPWETASAILGGDLVPLSDRQVNKWLADPSVFRALAYSELYWPGDALCRHLLGLVAGIAGQALPLRDPDGGIAGQALPLRGPDDGIAGKALPLPGTGASNEMLDTLMVKARSGDSKARRRGDGHGQKRRS